jgi:TonB family protein
VSGSYPLTAAVALFACSAIAQTNPVAPTDQRPASPAAPCQETRGSSSQLEILNDTMGVNFGPYLFRVVHDVRQNWHIPAGASFKRGYATIQFTINKDGSVTGLRLVSTTDDVEMDRAASEAITTIPFPPLPLEFKGNKLALRLTFAYNPGATDQKTPPQFGITPFGHVRVESGTSEQFTIFGPKTDTVMWSLGGPACDQKDCGAISKTGLYAAPARVPDPPELTVTATQDSAPFKSACARVIIVPPSPQN